MGGHFLLQRIFPTQGWNPYLLHWQEDSLPTEPPGKLLPGIYGAAYLGQELSKALGSRYHLGVTQRHIGQPRILQDNELFRGPQAHAEGTEESGRKFTAGPPMDHSTHDAFGSLIPSAMLVSTTARMMPLGLSSQAPCWFPPQLP